MLATIAESYGSISSYRRPHGVQSYMANTKGIIGTIGIIIVVQLNLLNEICLIKSFNRIYLIESLDRTQWNLLDKIFLIESAQGKTWCSRIWLINSLDGIYLLEFAQYWNMLDEIISIEFV